MLCDVVCVCVCVVWCGGADIAVVCGLVCMWMMDLKDNLDFSLFTLHQWKASRL